VATISDSTLAKVLYKLVREDLGEKNFTRAEAAEVAEDAKDHGWRSAHAVVEIPGYGDWTIAKDGHALAVEYVLNSMEEDPEAYGGFLQNYMTMSATDIRVYAVDAADSIAEDMGVDDLEDEIDSIASVVKAQAALDDAEEAFSDYEDSDDYDEAVAEVYEDAVTDAEEALETAKENALDEAREMWASDHADYIAGELRNDAPGYFMGQFGELPESLFSVDYAEAAEDAVSSDGAGSWLSIYDGNEYEIKVGNTYYAAFRTN
tara:strand:- start:497 stop:1282 length:786 start_codon:yes stop_codon:yes gene_type:complete